MANNEVRKETDNKHWWEKGNAKSRISSSIFSKVRKSIVTVFSFTGCHSRG